MFRPLYASIAIIWLIAPVNATPEMAVKIQQTWGLAVNKWRADAAKAVTPEQREKLIESQPDAAAYATRMWQAIGNSLNESWAIEPAAWFLQISSGITKPATIDDAPAAVGTPVPMFASQIDAIKKAVLEHHARNPDVRLYAMCIAMARLSDPFSLSILEKIESTNPDAQIQGVAALSAAMVIKNLGDDSELMRKRLTYIRKAIINSADVKIGDTTVATLAENELYLIRYLSKGREAPDITGVDTTGQAFRLSQQFDKVVILVFWSTTIPQAEHVIEYTNEMAAKFTNKPVVVIGINHDPLDKLRAMTTDGTVKWRNITDPENQLAKSYRVGNWPMVYVLDHKRRIHYAGGLGSFAELTADALADEIR